MGQINKELETFLRNEGYNHLKYIEGRGICGLYRFMFTVAVVYGLTEQLYEGRYCYPTFADAKTALENWDGQQDPQDDIWIKHKGFTEYSNPLQTKLIDP